jgi:CRISPR-associated endonuclease/helicase Cas3
MTGLLRSLLARHETAGGHALLLSATLGAAARTSLLSPAPWSRPKVPPLAVAAALPYPLISDRNSVIETRAGSRSRRIASLLRPWLDMPDAVAAHALEAARNGASVLIVRNTVAGAIAVQRALEALAPDDPCLFRAEGVIAPHHGRFAAPDRRLLDAAVENAFGKRAERRGGCVLVGTQTLEQSLDIDADLLLTDLCPMDVLLQRLGRLHRHARRRPTGFEEATAVVLVPEARDLSPFLPSRSRGLPRHGLGRVYPDLLAIEATWRLLETHQPLTLPEDNRWLVEHATHPDALATIAAELGDAWEKLRRELQGVAAAHGQHAAHVALCWEEDLLEMVFPSRPDERTATRLGTDDRRFRLDPPSLSPFGAMLEEVVVPGWLAHGIGAEIEVATIVRDAVGLLLTIGDVRFRYNKFGLERADA